ncbi:hypothetical protein B0675_39935 [Streptomyces sp. M41(2017)]|uniref:hypothetical protein n=1 Tax=Streptomyces sp. M41(2017) TaxID=1955065 RepID=UPI0009C0FAEC|nr:hypothetical protein [Streptomyces sp. M41(2017)]OQQ12990.1 hypothetical protein B0675_39935 [Streptomyces sp. M41(2017)]
MTRTSDRTTTDLTAWLGEPLTDRLTDAEQREAAHRIFRHIADQEEEATARNWMIGMNPHLNDQAPLLAIAAGQTADVDAAARAYIDGVWT